jgi:hypothetical protein
LITVRAVDLVGQVHWAIRWFAAAAVELVAVGTFAEVAFDVPADLIIASESAAEPFGTSIGSVEKQRHEKDDHDEP